MLLKQVPEDFIVEEKISLEFTPGLFLYVQVRKKNRTTLDVAQELARQLRIPLKHIGFAGLKDKAALTTQVFSLKSIHKERLYSVSLNTVELTVLGQGVIPVSLGAHEGNKFTIVVRDIDKLPIACRKVLNLFGEQRFSKNNEEIGHALIHKDFTTAAKLVAEQHEEARFALQHEPRNPIGALQVLPLKLLRLYVSAFQAHIWNSAVHTCQHAEKTLPLPGFGMREEECVIEVMKNEKVNARDFVIPQLPQVSAEGGERSVFVDVEELQIGQLLDDELNPGKKKCFLEFYLTKGAYATEVVKQMVK